VDFDRDLLKKLIQPKPIPELLHSAYEDGPFSTCTVCGENVNDGRLYEIQKVYRGKEVIFELAVCQRCGENAAKEFSQESTENLKNFLLDEFKPTSEITCCNFCGFPRGLTPNFTVIGACSEHLLVLPSIIMCEPCTDKLQTLLSTKTKDVQGDFVRDNFPGVPADLDLNPSFSGILG
jgi:hypothetical protein